MFELVHELFPALSFELKDKLERFEGFQELQVVYIEILQILELRL